MDKQWTAHQYAVELTHSRLRYGELLEAQPDVLSALKRALFKAARELFEEARINGIRELTTREALEGGA